jgi:hypothetical protein
MRPARDHERQSQFSDFNAISHVAANQQSIEDRPRQTPLYENVLSAKNVSIFF